MQSDKIFLIFFLFISLNSCKKKDEPKEDPNPVSCFTSSTQFLKVGDIINFSNCSTNYDRVEWNFGDGGSSTISEPSYKWDTKGVYTVTLKTFKGTVSNSISKTVVVGEAANFKFSAGFSQPQDSLKYTKFYAVASLCRASNLNTSYQDLFSIGTFTDSSHAFFWNDPSPIGQGIITEASTFRIKVRIIGSYQTTHNVLEPLDSLVTDVIDPFSGPKTPTGTTTLKSMNVSYTISPISFY